MRSLTYLLTGNVKNVDDLYHYHINVFAITRVNLELIHNFKYMVLAIINQCVVNFKVNFENTNKTNFNYFLSGFRVLVSELNKQYYIEKANRKLVNLLDDLVNKKHLVCLNLEDGDIQYLNETRDYVNSKFVLENF